MVDQVVNDEISGGYDELLLGFDVSNVCVSTDLFLEEEEIVVDVPILSEWSVLAASVNILGWVVDCTSCSHQLQTSY